MYDNTEQKLIYFKMQLLDNYKLSGVLSGICNAA